MRGARQISAQDRIRTSPNRRPRIVIPRPEVIQPRLRVHLLGGVLVRNPPGGRALLHPGLAKGEVGQVFVALGFLVGDVGGGAQVVRVVEVDELAAFAAAGSAAAAGVAGTVAGASTTANATARTGTLTTAGMVRVAAGIAPALLAAAPGVGVAAAVAAGIAFMAAGVAVDSALRPARIAAVKVFVLLAVAGDFVGALATVGHALAGEAAHAGRVGLPLSLPSPQRGEVSGRLVALSLAFAQSGGGRYRCRRGGRRRRARPIRRHILRQAGVCRAQVAGALGVVRHLAHRRARAQLGDDPAGAGIDVGRGDGPVPDREELVDVGGLAVLALLELSVAAVVVAEGGAVFGVLHLSDSVVFVPDDSSSGAVVQVLPAGLVAVFVVVEGAVADRCWGVRLGVAALPVGVGPVVAGGGFDPRATAGLGHGVLLVLVGDVVDGIKLHREVVVLHFARGGVDTLGLDQAVQVVVVEVLRALPAEFVAFRDGGAVGQAQDVAHAVIAVGQVLQAAGHFAGGSAQARLQPGQAAVGRVVAVAGGDAVAGHQVQAALEAVVVAGGGPPLLSSATGAMEADC